MSENLRFSNIFRAYKNVTLDINGLRTLTAEIYGALSEIVVRNNFVISKEENYHTCDLTVTATLQKH